jgi:hypothetical protein
MCRFKANFPLSLAIDGIIIFVIEVILNILIIYGSNLHGHNAIANKSSERRQVR